MKKCKTSKLLALILAMSMIIGNLTGIQVKAADVILYEVTSPTKTITSEGGTVVVNVKGENLPDTMYYRVRASGVDITLGTPVIVEPTEVQMVNNQFSIKIPKNSLIEVGGKVYINVNYENNFTDAKSVTLDVVESTGSESVDKTALNAKIADAKALTESEYTNESWNALKSALAKAEAVSANADAAESEVKEVLDALTKAMEALQSNGGSQAPDASKIQAKVVGKDGKPVAGIVFDLIDVETNTDIGDITSDGNGKLEYDASAIEFQGNYLVKIQSIAEYICQPNDGVTYTIDENKKVVAINQKPYTGSENITFTLTKVGGSTDPEQPDPEADEKTLVIHAKDEKGNLVIDCDFVMVDAEFPDNEGVAKPSYDGVVKFKLSDLNMTAGEIRVAKTSQYTAITPTKISFTCEKGIFKTVNGNVYDGKTAFDFVVKKDTDSNAPAEIKGLIPLKNFLSCEGGMVEVLVSGKNMMDKIGFEVLQNGVSASDIPVMTARSTDTMYEYDVTFPENDTETDRVYTLRVFVKDNPNVFMEKTVTVAGKEETDPDQPGPEEPDDTTEGTVTEAVVTPAHVGAEGGTVELQIKGTDLTDTNWGIDYQCYIAGTQIAANKPGTIKIKNQTAEGATLEIGKNPMANDFDYVISVGGKKDNKVQKQKEVTVTQDQKEKTLQYKVNPKLVVLADSNTVCITMDKEVVFASDDVESLKQYFYIVDGNKRIDVTEQDTIAIEGNQITVKFKNPIPELSSAANFYIDEGGLRLATPDNGISLLQGTYWVIDSKPRITQIAYDKDVFDYKGGKVTARLKGVRLDEVKKEQLEAKVTGMGFELTDPISVDIQAGAEPVVTFDLPENNTDKTISYLLSVYLDGVQVVEGINGNKAERAIVSVLPKGTANDEMTLSHMTITGNNKIAENADGTEITVLVSDSIGELKTELKLSGTNLDSSKTKVRAIDENGVIFPVYDIPE